MFAEIVRGDVRFKPKKLDLDMKHRESPIVKLSIEEAPKVELKSLPPHLRNVFLEKGDTLPLIIASSSEFGGDVKKDQKRYWVDYCGYYCDPS